MTITGGNSIAHTTNGKICRSGEIKMTGQYVYFWLKLKAYTLGNSGIDVVPTYGGYTTNVSVYDGSLTVNFDMGALPSGSTCYSASGSFPNCERKIPENMMSIAGVPSSKTGVIGGGRGGSGVYTGSSGGLTSSYSSSGYVATTAGTGSGASTGFPSGVNAVRGNGSDQCASTASTPHPINFALGFKHKTHSDYRGGALAFTRIYRSDSTWTKNSVGAFWHHNYDRTLNLISTPESTSVDLTDASGAVTVFRQDTIGNWEAIDQDTTSMLESVYTGSTHTGYLYTDNQDRREYYDLSGNLTRLEARGGAAVDLAYDSSDRLETVTAESGKTLALSYDSSNRVSGVVTPAGSFSYAYDGNGNLTTVTKPDTKTLVYHYEDTNFVNAMTGVTDEKGTRLETYAYDTSGRAISSKFAGDVEQYSVVYNADETTTVINPLGKQATFHFATIQGLRKIVEVEGHASTNCAAANKFYTYDARGFLASKTDWLGNVSTYTRDGNGSVTSMVQAQGDSAQRTITTTYDPVYRLPDVVTQTGKTTNYDYDSDGRITSVTVTDTTTSETRTTSYTYNANTVDSNGNTVLGRLSSVDGARTSVTDVTSYTYDSSLRLTKVTNPLGHEVETTSFDSANRPLTIENANDVQTTFVYDSLGRLSSSTVASGTPDAITTSYTYDDNGNVLTVTLPNGVIITNSYDSAQRLTGVTDDLGNTVTYTLDDAGNITKEEYKDNTSTLKYTLSTVYDELARIIESVDANLDSTAFDYDVNSNLTTITDGNLNATSYAFDGLDRLVSFTDALSGVTSYDLNDLDQNEGTTDPRSNTTSYSYNAFGDVTQEISPDRGTRTYSHDKAGNVTSMTDARSIVTDYTYDALNRLLTTSYPSDSTLDVALTYDAATGCGTSKGRLCSVTDASGSTSYIYDVLGRLTDVTETRGALSFTTSYAYDDAGILTDITLPSGRSVAYTLNGNGQVSGVSADVNSTSTTLASSLAYLPFGGLESMTYGNSIALTNTFNAAYQLTNRQIGSMMNDAYTYDAAGNITVKGSDSYTLDALYRITGENTDSYSYDAIGNRLSKNLESYSYPLDSSKLDDIDSVMFTHDAAGNITADTQRSYVVDAAGHVKEVKISSSTVGAYVYNANNQRSQKTVGSTVTHYVYGAGGLLYGEYDSTGGLIREYVYLNGQPLAQIDAGETLRYLHTDHLGTPRYASSTSGVQVWNWDSDAFGNGAPTGSATVNLRFAGQYYDGESDLHYNWNRYYDPETGRYISSDPIGLDGGLNTFGYVSANPVMFIDPEGLSGQAIVGGTVLWLGSYIAVQTCALITACKEHYGEALQNAIDSVGDAVKDAIDYCTGNSGSASDDTDGKDPCRGLRNQVIDHEKKLGQYRDDPLSMDNKGFLADALAKGDKALYEKIYKSRIKSLQKQINNFRRQLEICEKNNGFE